MGFCECGIGAGEGVGKDRQVNQTSAGKLTDKDPRRERKKNGSL